MDFRDRVALVTGGTGALGSAVVRDLLAAGAHVAATYTVETEWQHFLASTAHSRAQLKGIPVDLTEADEVKTAVQSLHTAHGRLDFLLAIAGGFAPGKIHETSEAVWDRMLNLNLKTLFSILRPVIPVMIKQNFGRIITVSSGAIVNSPGAGVAAYAVSKAAVRHLSEVLAEEVKGHNIRVHCLMPGTMDTEANRRSMPNADFSQWVGTGEVARIIHRLLLDDADSPLVVPILHPGGTR
ncbi:MAG TPA: SDR family NAD(P)-dependent oxidoreductase [Terriglobia bacterium]|nr:SDR family NAD(P)-dependent oxidoreductase [Terriglobia bacterium]